MAFRRIQSFSSFPRASSATKMGHGTMGEDGTFSLNCLVARIALCFESRGLYIYIWRKVHLFTGMELAFEMDQDLLVAIQNGVYIA